MATLQTLIGKKFNKQVADGFPEFTVKKLVRTGVYKCVCENKNDLDNYGNEITATTEEIAQSIRRKNMWANLNKKQDAEWFERIKLYNLKPGDIVHDTRGKKNGAFRCVLQENGSLKVIGYVGELESYREPKIHYNVGGELEIWEGWLTELKEPAQIWSNRIKEFPELNGDFSWRNKPTLKKELPTITEQVKAHKRRLEEITDAYKEFYAQRIDFAEYKKRVSAIK